MSPMDVDRLWTLLGGELRACVLSMRVVPHQTRRGEVMPRNAQFSALSTQVDDRITARKCSHQWYPGICE